MLGKKGADSFLCFKKGNRIKVLYRISLADKNLQMVFMFSVNLLCEAEENSGKESLDLSSREFTGPTPISPLKPQV